MFDIMTREASNCDLKELFQKFVPEVIGREIEKASQGIYPLQNVYVRKVRLVLHIEHRFFPMLTAPRARAQCKILKAPRYDASKLMELHGETGTEETGTKVASDFKEPEVLASV